jgi:hypothetical protein
VSENGGVEEDTRYCVLQAQVSLNRYNAIWKSDLKLRQKIRFLKSHVFPSLVYTAECGNHTQLELGLLDVLSMSAGADFCKSNGSQLTAP